MTHLRRPAVALAVALATSPLGHSAVAQSWSIETSRGRADSARTETTAVVEAVETVSVQGSRITRELACGDGASAVVEGRDNTVRITGRCASLRVEGSSNTVSFDVVGPLSISGRDLSVEGRQAGRLVLEGSANTLATAVLPAGPTPPDRPDDVRVEGRDNRVRLELRGPARLSVFGSSTQVLWSTAAGVPAPKVALTGRDLDVRALTAAD